MVFILVVDGFRSSRGVSFFFGMDKFFWKIKVAFSDFEGFLGILCLISLLNVVEDIVISSFIFMFFSYKNIL